jgi:hypothetical protein
MVYGSSATAHSRFRGGFGGLACLIGDADLPKSQREVVDPHPNPGAIAPAASMPRINVMPQLFGECDILIAKGVFEHAPDSFGLTAKTAEPLHVGG